MKDVTGVGIDSTESWDVDVLGPVVETFRTPKGDVIFQAIVCCVLAAVGVGLLIAFPDDPWTRPFYILGMVFCSLASFVALRATVRFATMKVYLCEKGFRILSCRSAKSFPWKSSTRKNFLPLRLEKRLPG